MFKKLFRLDFAGLVYGAAVLILFGLNLFVIDRLRDYTILLDGERYQLTTIAFTPRQLLKQVGYSPLPNDQVWPKPDQINLSFTLVTITRARPITILTPDQTYRLTSAELRPANLLLEAGLRLFPHDLIEQNDSLIDPYAPLPAGQEAVFTFRPAKKIELSLNGQALNIFTQANSLSAALMEAGIELSENSTVSRPLDRPLDQLTQVTIATGRPIVVDSPAGSVHGFSSARTVGEALSDLGLSLQGLDQAVPPETDPLPSNGFIKINRVSETIAFQTIETAFNNTYQEDPEAELDTVSTLVPGQLGLVVTRVRTKNENGREVSALSEGPWKASDPIDGVLGRGAKPVVRTEVVDGVTLEYWRKVTVYATGYMPSSQGNHTGTASGLPLTKGIIAVILPWYRDMKFQKVYVPGYGYGTIADTGGGIPGRYWIDLGFDDSNYESWHHWTTLYFLTPIPAFIPTVLP